MNDLLRKEIDVFLSYCLTNKKEGSVEVKCTETEDELNEDGYTMNVQIGFDGCYMFFENFEAVLSWAHKNGGLLNALKIYTT